MLKLDLGHFNRCVTYASPDFGTIDYSINSESVIFYYTHHDSDIVSKRVGDFVSVPTFDIGVCTKDGDVDDPNVVERLLAEMEINIFYMLRRIVKEYCRDFNFENILIPIKEIHVFNEDPKKYNGPRQPPTYREVKGCYGWVKIGIAAVVSIGVKV